MTWQSLLLGALAAQAILVATDVTAAPEAISCAVRLCLLTGLYKLFGAFK